MASLYNLSTEYQELYTALVSTADEETGEVDVDIAAALANVQGTFEEKAIATATVSRMLGNTVEEVSKEIDRLKRLKAHLEREDGRVREYLKRAMEMTGTEKVQGISASISFRKSEQTVIDNEGELPEEYITVKTTYTPNKTAIKAAIKAGNEVPGAHIETVMNLQIK